MLHIKYRPQSWREVVGNEDTVKYLESVVENPERPHAYLFHGPTGCGKTTLARILAAELGCDGSDFAEVDVADYRGIDSIREIRQQMQMAPLMSNCRVWLLDECHRLTSDAQSALLKALEDAPEHVYFMLATTEPKKLLPTIQNRCTPCPVERLEYEQMGKLLLRTYRRAAGRKGAVDKDAVMQICEAADGCPRQALVMLEKHLANPDAPIEALTADSKEIIDLCRVLLKRQSWATVRKTLMALKGQDPEDIRRAVLGYAAAVMLKADNAQALLLLDVFKEPFYNSGWPGVVWACAVCVQK